MRRAILGPVLADLDAVGLNEDEALLATAFYSSQRLGELELQAERVELLIRLDLRSPDEWMAGSVAPDGLLAFVKRHEKRATSVRVFCSPTAHAKAYVGAAGFLVGSANLSVRGFGGLANEILWLEDDAGAMRKMRKILREYRSGLRQVSTEQLECYVRKHSASVRAARRARWKRRDAEDSLPEGRIVRPPRLGEYQTFLEYLRVSSGSAAREIYERAHGKGQLSGHIKRNFFGLRQFLVAYPRTMRYLTRKNPGAYQLYRDSQVQSRLESFVRREAADEEDLKVDTWKTYLPESSGGKPKSGGGTIGNLNRMLPLVSRYLQRRLQ